jgi:hypothetical protein
MLRARVSLGSQFSQKAEASDQCVYLRIAVPPSLDEFAGRVKGATGPAPALLLELRGSAKTKA